MTTAQPEVAEHFAFVNNAFSRQSAHYDEDDDRNPVLKHMRQKVYRHLARYLQPRSRILELNAGTGIDASWLAEQGHQVLATDLSDGMIQKLKEKQSYSTQLDVMQLSYTELDKLEGRKFNYVFSNFGGLNCVSDLRTVTRHLAPLLQPGAFITFVIMPPICLWEQLTVLKGNKNAFRRLKRNGVRAHLEGHYFTTYYHPLPEIKKSFPPQFRFVASEGLGALHPQPHHLEFPIRFPRLFEAMKRIDDRLSKFFPFNRWADHIIVTFQYLPDAGR